MKALSKLSLRDLFAVVTLAAVLVAWWLDHQRLTRQLQSRQYETRAFQVTYSQSDDLAAVLRTMYQRDAESPLGIASDARTNTVIVRSPAGKMSEVEKMILQLDGPPSVRVQMPGVAKTLAP